MDADNLGAVSKVTIAACWGVAALASLAAVLNGIWIVMMIQSGFPPAIGLIAGSLRLILFLASLLSIIAVLIWFYRARHNLRKAGVSGLRFSPAWSVISFFVPVANLFIPFRSMRELVNRSNGEPEEWAESSVEAVSSWWACFVGAAILSTVVWATRIVDSVPGIFVTTPIWATETLSFLSFILTAGSAFFLIKIVCEVSAAQALGVKIESTFE